MSDYESIIKKLLDDGSKKKDYTSKTMKKKDYGPSLSYLDLSKEGMYKFRIFPDRKGVLELPFFKVARHWWTNPTSGKKSPYKCSGSGCPMCAFYTKQEAKGDPAAWQYKVKNVYMYYGINESEKVCLITTNYYVNEEIKKKMVAQFKAGIDVMSLKEGRWVILTIKKVSGVFKYQVSIEEEHEANLAQREQYIALKPLNQFYTDFTNEELEKIVKGQKVERTESPAPVLKEEKVDETDLKDKFSKTFPELYDSDIVDDVDFDESLLHSDEELERMASKDVSKPVKGKSKLSSLYEEDED